MHNSMQYLELHKRLLRKKIDVLVYEMTTFFVLMLLNYFPFLNNLKYWEKMQGD